MTKLARYLKPYILPILLCVVLLFVQANADLNLPNYMSDIVNVGIQQSGVEHSYPEAISADGLALMKTFLSEEDRALADRAYTLVEEGVPEWEKLKKEYPAITGAVYTARRLDTQDSAAESRVEGRAGYALVDFLCVFAGIRYAYVTDTFAWEGKALGPGVAYDRIFVDRWDERNFNVAVYQFAVRFVSDNVDRMAVFFTFLC